jgi:hypothetical protein
VYTADPPPSNRTPSSTKKRPSAISAEGRFLDLRSR